MPVAAKFSETFYGRFGHEATDELVEYLNAVDASFRSDLKAQNDANWARFEARLDQRLAELKAELLKWMFLFWVGTMGTVLAILKL